MSEENINPETEESVKGLHKDQFEEGTSQHIPLSGSMQYITGDDLIAAIDKYASSPKEDGKKPTDAELKDMKAELFSALSGQWRNGRYKEIFDAAIHFAQGLELNGKRIGITHPVKKLTGDGKLTGLDAIRAISSAAGVGKETEVILPASGLRLKLGTFREKEILNLQVELSERRLDVGRQTRGAMFSSDDVHLVVSVIDFILKHVIDSTVRIADDDYTETLRKLIRVPDLPALMCGALAGMYPNGYPFIHRCMNPECGYNTFNAEDPEKGPKLMFKYLHHWDPSKVTPKRFRHLSAVWKAHTVDAVKEYQEESCVTGTIPLEQENGSVIYLDIKAPSYDHYRHYTTSWLTDVMSMVDAALEVSDATSKDESRSRRANYLQSTINRLSLLRHGAWVNEIRVTTDEGTATVDETADIYAVLEDLCKESKIVQAVYPEIDKVRVKSLFGYTGLVVFDCPECGHEQQSEKPDHPNIIPVNITSYFFDIMGYRTLASLR